MTREPRSSGAATRAVAAGIIAVSLLAATGCRTAPALERLIEARRLSGDALVQFTKAADASNRAVMADTDEASITFAREADQAKQAVQHDVDALRPMLQGLGYTAETQLLDEFGSRFAEYGALDRTILDLAVQNTNLKAQRLSFGPGREAADAFRDALEAVVPMDTVRDGWRVRALAATAVAAVRELQALQAPHIADASDAAMSRMEQQMAGAEAVARKALEALGPLARPASRPRVAAATAALDRFMAVNVEVTALSRRNTNVRSLALSLNEKGKLTGACENSLRALRDALAARGFTGTR